MAHTIYQNEAIKEKFMRAEIQSYYMDNVISDRYPEPLAECFNIFF